MLQRGGAKYFGLFSLPLSYNIDKNLLKERYHKILMASHPDATSSALAQKSNLYPSVVNEAYTVLSDDFLRAKLFTTPIKILDPSFLSECLEIEEKICEGVNVGPELSRMLAECRKRYDDPHWMAKWAYYKRLKELFDAKQMVSHSSTQ